MKTALQGLLEPEVLLFEACQKGNVAGVQEAVESGVNTAAVNAMGQNALFWAAAPDVAERLLDLGLKDVVDHAGETALEKAIAAGRKDIAACLVGKQGQLAGWPLHVAAEHNDSDTCALLIESGKVDVDATNEKGITPLLVASKAGSTGAVLLLLNHADMEATDGRGRNALHLAVIGGHEEVAKALAEADSELAEQKDAEGCTPAEYARDDTMRALAGRQVKREEQKEEKAAESIDAQPRESPIVVAASSGGGGGGYRLMTFEDEVLDLQVGGADLSAQDLEKRVNAFFAQCGDRIVVVSSSLSCVHIPSGSASAPGRIRRTLAIVVRY